MFGIGFTELLVIVVVAVLFIGPDKLPETMVQIAKFFKSAKKSLGTLKDSIEQEMDVKSMKDEALAYKKSLMDTTQDVKSATDFKAMAAKLTTLEDDIFPDDGFFDEPKKPEVPAAPQAPTLKKSDVVSATAAKDEIKEEIKNV